MRLYNNIEIPPCWFNRPRLNQNVSVQATSLNQRETFHINAINTYNISNLYNEQAKKPVYTHNTAALPKEQNAEEQTNRLMLTVFSSGITISKNT